MARESETSDTRLGFIRGIGFHSNTLMDLRGRTTFRSLRVNQFDGSFPGDRLFPTNRSLGLRHGGKCTTSALFGQRLAIRQAARYAMHD